VVHLAGADRGIILWRNAAGDRRPRPFVVVDLAHDPARLGLAGVPLDHCEAAEAPTLYDLAPGGVLVYLGSRHERAWCLFADGGEARALLDAKRREDILFLAGECAGLLFLRDFADEADDS
jgi:hypothetical protein